MSFSGWHHYAYGVLAALLAVSIAISTGAVVVPTGLKDIAPYAGLVVVFLGALLPAWRDDSGPIIPHG